MVWICLLINKRIVNSLHRAIVQYAYKCTSLHNTIKDYITLNVFCITLYSKEQHVYK